MMSIPRRPRLADSCAIPLLLALPLLTLSAPAGAVRSPDVPPTGWIPLHSSEPVATDEPAKTSQDDSRWQNFQTRNPGWLAIWNDRTGTVHRAIGRGIPTSHPVASAEQAAAAAERFLRTEHEVTGAANIELELMSAVKPRRVWYVHFRQLYQGIPVLNTDVTVRLWEDGRVIAFGSDARTDIALDPRPWIEAGDARIRSTEGLHFDFNRDRVSGGDELRILPLESPDRPYALVRRVRVSQSDPPHEWDTMVDAHTGELLWRYDRVQYVVGGRVSSLVHPAVPSDPLTEVSNRNMHVNVNGVDVLTDALGEYLEQTDPGSVDLRFEIRGPYGWSLRADNHPTARVEMTVDGSLPDPIDLLWDNSNSHPSERDAFHSAERVHEHIKSIDPSLTVLDYRMPIRVLVDGSCNAFWNGEGINFLKGSTRCNNSAMILDVVAHEYGHGLNEKLYRALRDDPMTNGALNEALADITAAFMLDSPVIGHEFFRDGGTIRTVDNDRRFPDDIVHQVHRDGLILGGTLWDLRQDIGLETAERLVHFAKYGTPDSDSWQYKQKEAFAEFLLEMLLADEDDGDLSNGSPHSASILAAFAQHGLGLSMTLRFRQWKVENPEDAEAARVVIDVSSILGSPPVDPGSVTLHYRLDLETEVHTLPMALRGGDTYEVTLPPLPEGTILSYYFSAAVEGFPATSHRVDPETMPWFKELLGERLLVFEDDFSNDRGWTVGAPDDDATDGVWSRNACDLIRVADRYPGGDVQPSGDHTYGHGAVFPFGAVFGTEPQEFCINQRPEPIGCAEYDYMGNEVDGQTTLFSPVFDLSDAKRPVIDYVWWFTNDIGPSPDSDPWRVEISNDGGQTWVTIRETTRPTVIQRLSSGAGRFAFYPQWWRELFQVEEYVTPTSQVQLRFVVADLGEDSLVEALIDDFYLYDFAGTPVPVAVRSFQVEWQEGGALLSWSTPVPGLVLEARAGAAVWRVETRTAGPDRFEAVDRSPHLAPGTSVEYRLLDPRDPSESAIASTTLTVPAVWTTRLLEPRPNPFNPRTTVSFTLDRRQRATVTIYDIAGRRVVTLHDGIANAGRTDLIWEGADDHNQSLASGVYLVGLRTRDSESVRKLVLLR